MTKNSSIGLDATAILDVSDFDAKGDLLAGTGSDAGARLAVGTNDYVLTADSNESTGLKWAAGGGGGGLSEEDTVKLIWSYGDF